MNSCKDDNEEEEEEETTDRPDRSSWRTQQNTSFIIMRFYYGFTCFPGRSENQKFYVLGYSVMNKNDALVSKDREFFPVPFADAYLFNNPERAQNYIDQNGLKNVVLRLLKLFNTLELLVMHHLNILMILFKKKWIKKICS